MVIMKETRKIFMLVGRTNKIFRVLGQLQFKGTLLLFGDELTEEDIQEIFQMNKSVICANAKIPQRYESQTIKIYVGRISWGTEPCICINGDVAAQFQEIAENMNCDIGDHKSNSSGMQQSPTISDCKYCKFILHDDDINRSIYQSKNFVVIPTVGEFITGYLLIIPKRHVMSLAEFNAEEKTEFTEVLSDVKTMLQMAYNTEDFLVWENGTGNGGKGKAKDSIVHAHVHVAPSNLNFQKIQEMSKFDFKKVSYEKLSNYGKHSYLLMQENENFWRINDNPDLYIPRQYVRQLLAEEHGMGDQWNWRNFPFYEKMTQTRLDISNGLSTHWKEINPRIKERTEDFIIK